MPNPITSLPEHIKWRIFSFLPRDTISKSTFLLRNKSLSNSVGRFQRTYPDHSGIGIFTSKKIKNHLGSNQIYWNTFSDESVQLVVKKLRQTNGKISLLDLYKLLGERREAIAKELKHGNDKTRAYFGKLRQFTGNEYGAVENISATSVWQAFYKPAVAMLIPRLSTNFTRIDSDTYKSVTKNISGSSDLTIQISMDNQTSTIKQILIQYPFVSKHSWPELLEFNDIAFNKHVTRFGLDSACQYFSPAAQYRMLLDWDGKDLNEFMMNLGKLSYHLYRLIPLKRGNAAAVNWLVRAIAEYRGVQLGHEKVNGLPLDFRALLTFDDTEYANWFVKSAYETIVLDTKSPITSSRR